MPPPLFFVPAVEYGSNGLALSRASVLMLAPEQANERNVTELWGSVISKRMAAWAGPAIADLWQRSSSHLASRATIGSGMSNGPVANFCGTSGLPSPEP